MAATGQSATPTPAGGNKWALSGWNKGKVTLFQALGLKGAQYPQLKTRLTAGAAMNATPAGQSGNGNGSGSANPGSSGPATGGLGGTGASNGCSAAQTSANQKLGRQLAASYGWGTGAQWDALNNVVMSESGWCNAAQNPTSTAYGIGQFLNTTWAGVGYTKTSDAKTQIQAMLAYIKQRYGNPVSAWNFHKANNWY